MKYPWKKFTSLWVFVESVPSRSRRLNETKYTTTLVCSHLLLSLGRERGESERGRGRERVRESARERVRNQNKPWRYYLMTRKKDQMASRQPASREKSSHNGQKWASLNIDLNLNHLLVIGLEFLVMTIALFFAVMLSPVLDGFDQLLSFALSTV